MYHPAASGFGAAGVAKLAWLAPAGATTAPAELTAAGAAGARAAAAAAPDAVDEARGRVAAVGAAAEAGLVPSPGRGLAAPAVRLERGSPSRDRAVAATCCTFTVSFTVEPAAEEPGGSTTARATLRSACRQAVKTDEQLRGPQARQWHTEHSLGIQQRPLSATCVELPIPCLQRPVIQWPAGQKQTLPSSGLRAQTPYLAWPWDRNTQRPGGEQ